MTRFILLLRGINVGGNNKVSMKELKELLEQNGYSDVVTYINSGNILFSTDKNDIGFLKEACEKLLLQKFNLKLTVAVIPANDLIEAYENAPDWWGEDPDSKHNALFVITPTSAKQVIQEVGELKPEYEKVGFYGNVIFWSAPVKTFSRTRWSKIVGTSAYHHVTIRNANTMKKLVELCR